MLSDVQIQEIRNSISNHLSFTDGLIEYTRKVESAARREAFEEAVKFAYARYEEFLEPEVQSLADAMREELIDKDAA